MRLTNVFSGRPSYYDRTPLDSVQTYSQTIAPTLDTVRWTYTVPSLRKAYVESVLAATYRVTAATTAALVRSYVAIGPGAAGFGDIVLALFNSNNISAADQRIVGGIAILVAGDAIRTATADASTAGTVAFDNTAKITEFDV